MKMKCENHCYKLRKAILWQEAQKKEFVLKARF